MQQIYSWPAKELLAALADAKGGGIGTGLLSSEQSIRCYPGIRFIIRTSCWVYRHNMFSSLRIQLINASPILGRISRSGSEMEESSNELMTRRVVPVSCSPSLPSPIPAAAKLQLNEKCSSTRISHSWRMRVAQYLVLDSD